MQKLIIRYGAIYGIITVIMTFLYYQGLSNMWINSLLGLVLLIFVVVKSGRQYRTENGGYASFIQLLKLFTGIFIVGIIISSLFSFLYTSLISEESKQALIDKLVDTQVNTVSKFLPEDQVMDMEDLFRSETAKIFEPITLLKNLVSGLFGSMLISLIPAAIMRKSPTSNNINDNEILDA